MILERFEPDALTSTCRVNRHLSSLAIPILWRDIDFESWEHFKDAVEDHGRMHKFFLICDGLRRERPERWQILASHVQILKLKHGRVTGVSYNEYGINLFRWSRFNDSGGNILDLIAAMPNLRCLHMSAKGPLGNNEYFGPKSIENMRGALPNLSELKIGGALVRDVVFALLSFPERIQNLKCIALQDDEDKENSPGSQGLRFLRDMAPLFTCLTDLHLCKLAEISESKYQFVESENDQAISEDWSNLLPHVSPTLVRLTLEDRHPRFHQGIMFCFSMGSLTGDWGAESRLRFKQTVLGTITDQDWPRLKAMTLINVARWDDDVQRTLGHFQDRIDLTVHERWCHFTSMQPDIGAIHNRTHY